MRIEKGRLWLGNGTKKGISSIAYSKSFFKGHSLWLGTKKKGSALLYNPSCESRSTGWCRRLSKADQTLFTNAMFHQDEALSEQRKARNPVGPAGPARLLPPHCTVPQWGPDATISVLFCAWFAVCICSELYTLSCWAVCRSEQAGLVCSVHIVCSMICYPVYFHWTMYSQTSYLQCCSWKCIAGMVMYSNV